MAISLMLPLVGKTQADLQRVDKGTGSLSFTRSTTATRLNPDTNLIEAVASGDLREDGRVYKNLLSYSEARDNGYWGAKDGVTIAPNAAVAPDGKTTADKITETAATSLHYHGKDTSGRNGVVYAHSIYAKAAGRNRIRMNVTTNQTVFNLLTGVVVSGIGTITPVGNGWYRCSMSDTPNGTSIYLYVTLQQDDGTETYAGDVTKGVYVWGTQLEIGSSPTHYAKSGSSPAYSPLGVLIEGQRTNLALNSGDLSQWTSHGADPFTQNYGIAPDGTQTSCLITDTTMVDTRGKMQGIGIPANSLQYVASIFCKAGSADHFVFTVYPSGGTPTNVGIEITFSTGSVSVWQGQTPINYGVIPYPNGWYRIWLTTQNNNSTLASVYAVVGTADIGSVELWGGQFEQGSYPSSYIPTTSAAVTRNQDDLLIQRSGNFDNAISSAFMEFDAMEPLAAALLASDNASVANTVLYQAYVAPNTRMVGFDGVTMYVGSILTLDARQKIVAAWGSGIFKTSVDGGAVVVDGRFSNAMGLTTNLRLGSYGSAGTLGRSFGHLKSCIVFNRVLTDADMQAITTAA
jgi:hypothetical protein